MLILPLRAEEDQSFRPAAAGSAMQDMERRGPTSWQAWIRQKITRVSRCSTLRAFSCQYMGEFRK
jgi:hypothetical protein